MSKKQRTEEEFRQLFVEWVSRLDLLHWNFELEIGKGVKKEDAEAWAKVHADYNWAKISVDEDWRIWPIRRVNKAICHELIHCHVENLFQAGVSAEEYLGTTAGELYIERLTHDLERSVDSLANAIVKYVENEQED